MEDIMPPIARTLREVSLKYPLITQRRILLVDQEAGDREWYTRQLRERGLSVRACSSYDEGERWLERESYHLVIVDQGGPAFEGKVIAVRSILKDRMVPVLVITRHHHMPAYVEAMHLGAADYLEKPIPVHALLWRIDTNLPPHWVTKQAS
jgi:DNA-binding response OmpR family regulator